MKIKIVKDITSRYVKDIEFDGNDQEFETLLNYDPSFGKYVDIDVDIEAILTNSGKVTLVENEVINDYKKEMKISTDTPSSINYGSMVCIKINKLTEEQKKSLAVLPKGITTF